MSLAAYLDAYRAEAGDLLQTLTTLLLRLERDPADAEALREMFRAAHTIKGGAAMLGLADIRDLAHAAEDVLGHLRDDRRPLSPDLVSRLFQAFDTLGTLIAADDPNDASAAAVGAEIAVAPRGAADAPPGEDSSQAPPPAAAEDQSAGPSDPAGTPAPPRVLLVEDSPTVRLLETLLLTDAGFVVETVDDGREALARAQTGVYDLIVTGAETKELRGLELAIEVRRTLGPADLPIILMASDESPDHFRRAQEAGIQARVPRGPRGEERLLEAARALTARPSETVRPPGD